MANRTLNEMRRWALIGAAQRLAQLAEETAAIHNAFPELLKRRKGRTKSRSGGQATAAGAVAKSRRRRTMSAEARKRISDAQKARWAKQKSKKG